jgi:cobyrinic acid a,c-diamide synthase
MHQLAHRKWGVHCDACLQDDSVAVPERYLGLTMPHEQADQQQGQDSSAEVATAQQQSASETGCSSFVPPYLTRLAQHVSQHVDLDLLLELAVDVQLPATDILQQQSPTELSTETSLGQSVGPGASAALVLKQQPRPAYKCRIAVARDEAFCFYYQV